MNHRLRRKPPRLVPILVWSPWSRFLEQRGSGSLVPARGGHPGGRGGVGEHEGHESYLWVVSVDAEVVGGGPATGAGGRRRRWAATARFRRPIRGGLGPGSTSASGQIRLGARCSYRPAAGGRRRAAWPSHGSRGGAAPPRTREQGSRGRKVGRAGGSRGVAHTGAWLAVSSHGRLVCDGSRQVLVCFWWRNSNGREKSWPARGDFWRDGQGRRESREKMIQRNLARFWPSKTQNFI